MRLRLAGALAALLLVTLACGWLGWRAPVHLTDAAPRALVRCDRTRSSFELVSSLYPSGNTWNGRSAQLLGPGVLAREVCAPGTLRLRVHATAAAGAGPRVTISLGGEAIDDREVTSGGEYSVHIPRSGYLSVAYLNDRYVSHTRYLTLWSIRPTGAADCGGPLRLRPEIRSGIVDWHGDTGTLYGQVSLPLRACGPGRLHLSVTGGSSDGQRPHLRVRQGNAILLERDVLGLEQLSVAVPGAGSLAIELTNGFFQEVADRNIWIDRLTFEPGPG